MKQYKIFAIIILILIVIMAFLFVTQPEAEEGYTEYVVTRGETLWSIADELTDNADLRAVIYDIKKESGLSSAAIFVGDVLRVPNKYINEVR